MTDLGSTLTITLIEKTMPKQTQIPISVFNEVDGERYLIGTVIPPEKTRNPENAIERLWKKWNKEVRQVEDDTPLEDFCDSFLADLGWKSTNGTYVVLLDD